MRQSVLYVIVCVFLFQAAAKTVVYIDWKMHRQRITELYCINKDNPMMHCEGKCYLSLKLKKIESDYQHSKTPPKMNKGAEILLFSESIPIPEIHPMVAETNPIRGGIPTSGSTSAYIPTLIKPPACFSVSCLSA